MLSDQWRPARRSSPCPICGKPDWCQTSSDGRAVICRRVQSDKPQKNGGWFHHVTGATRAAPPPAATPAQSRHDFELLTRSFKSAVHPLKLQRLADELRLDVGSLTRLDAGWAGDRFFCRKCGCRRNAWTFPMQRHPHTVTGIRLRFVPCSHKQSITGGHEGLFVPHDLCEDRLFVCEGPTDTAALLDLGLPAVGRPSCTGGVGHIVTFVKARFIARLVIVADGDGPGQQGAHDLAQRARPYCRDVRLITPPAGVKDARAWKHQGATAADVEQLVAAAPPWRLIIKFQSNNSTSREGVSL